MTATPDAVSRVNESLTPFSVAKVDNTPPVPTPRCSRSGICIGGRRARFICRVGMLSLLAFTPNAFGETMHGRRLVNSSAGGSSSGGHGESSHDSVSPGEAAIQFDFAHVASPHLSGAKVSTPSFSKNQPHSTPMGFPLNWRFSLFKDLFSRAAILISNKSAAPQSTPQPTNGPSDSSNAGHNHEHVIPNWDFHSRFELNLPHFTESFHAANHFEITKDNHGIDLNWSRHGSVSFEINTPSIHEEFCFSDCFSLNLHWQPGVGFSFSEHLAFNSHFDLQIGHFNWERHPSHHHNHHHNHHHSGGCHQPPDPPLPSAVPEPTSLALLGFGGLGLIAALGKRRHTNAMNN